MATLHRIDPFAGAPRVTGGDASGQPPYDGSMESRVIKLEDFAVETRDRLTRIETKLDANATKAEMHDLKAELIKWMVGLTVGLGAAAITVMTFVLNNAAPKSVQPAAAPIPIIINIPVQQPALTSPVPSK